MSDDKDEPKGAIDLILHQAAKGKEQTIELRKAIDGLRESQVIMREFHKIRAEMRHEQYRQYVEAGFTADQALELVKAGD